MKLQIKKGSDTLQIVTVNIDKGGTGKSTVTYNFADLQTLTNKKFKYETGKTLSIAQTLYEKKFLSYPRSDSNYIGTPGFEYLKSNLSNYLELANQQIEYPQFEEKTLCR